MKKQIEIYVRELNLDRIVEWIERVAGKPRLVDDGQHDSGIRVYHVGTADSLLAVTWPPRWIAPPTPGRLASVWADPAIPSAHEWILAIGP